MIRTTKPRQLNIKESIVMSSVKQWLDLRGVLYVRNNSGAVKTQAGRFITFGGKGWADIIALHKGRALAIECKSSSGRQSPEQKAFQANWEHEGGVYLLLKPDNWHKQLEGVI